VAVETKKKRGKVMETKRKIMKEEGGRKKVNWWLRCRK
jgi:hypothetical protein